MTSLLVVQTNALCIEEIINVLIKEQPVLNDNAFSKL